MAMNLEKVRSVAPGLIDLYKTAKVSLDKRGLAGRRAAVYLVLDRSGSMRRYYKDGTVQHLAEQALGLSANLDDDGIVPVVFFDTIAHPPVEISLNAYQGRINTEHERLGHMGRTNYAAAMRTVLDHYESSRSTDPAFVIFQTDGSPESRTEAQQVLCEAASRPLFWQFIGFGDDEFRFLKKLDELPVPTKRVVDNAGFFEAGPEPRAMTDGLLYDRLMEEFPDWIAAAAAAGILPTG